MTSIAFWKGAGERAGKTFLQVGIATLGISAGSVYSGEAALRLPWETALVTALLAALLSVVTSLLNPSFTAGTAPASTTDSGALSGVAISDGSVVPDTDPGAGSGDVTTEDIDQTVTAHTPEHAEDASVIPDGEGVATSQS
ncbi:Uncharacterised protein [Acidipropionibacterium jensenii]|uniref:Holin n=1 Tax=Acidipropionibacterium jensenii TaxID=1749 RepID=A0A448P1Z8_9ACTN|nr:holin [Acidipropionibacterium jensenii]VEI04095.1 Uncharacterised protein [Acidipropionibacterium jensenii]